MCDSSLRSSVSNKGGKRVAGVGIPKSVAFAGVVVAVVVWTSSSRLDGREGAGEGPPANA